MNTTPILKNRIFLYLTEFFAGMSVMAVELGASRLLAPYFSSSQIVWTIIIGTIMIAMALGNIYGGKSADKNPNPDRLYTRILIAGVWIALIPVVGIYHYRHFRAAHFCGKYEFSDLGGICGVYGDLCVSAFPAGNGDAVPCEIHGAEPFGQWQYRGNAGRV